MFGKAGGLLPLLDVGVTRRPNPSGTRRSNQWLKHRHWFCHTANTQTFVLWLLAVNCRYHQPFVSSEGPATLFPYLDVLKPLYLTMQIYLFPINEHKLKQKYLECAFLVNHLSTWTGSQSSCIMAGNQKRSRRFHTKVSNWPSITSPPLTSLTHWSKLAILYTEWKINVEDNGLQDCKFKPAWSHSSVLHPFTHASCVLG